MNHRGTTVLITGASSGIGAQLARALADRGANLVLVARRAARLESLASELHEQHGVTVLTKALDVGITDAHREIRTFVERHGITIDSLVNSAGFGMHGALVEADAARIDEQIRVNVAALTAITREFLPDMIDPGRGFLLNVASTAALQPVPGMAVYGATKAFVLSFTEAVAYETRGSGVKVVALCPGATSTEFFDIVGTDRAQVGQPETVEQVVATALRALDKSKTSPVVISGRRNRALAVVARVLPRRIVTSTTARLMSRNSMRDSASADETAAIGALRP